jgi:vitamin B12 transporter
MRKISLITALLASAALPAFAQTAEDEDIVVTATRSPTPIARLPAQINVVDTDDARAEGEVTLDQVVADIPGLQAPRTGPIGQQTSIFSGGFESNHTLVLFDGVRMDDPSTPEGLFDAGQDTLADASRVEIVQGPMSALYGSNALGGVINMIARRGGEGPLNMRFDAAVGSFDTLTASIGADGTLGRFRYALSGEGYASEGYDIVPERISTHTGEEDGADITTVTGVFDYALTDALSIDLLVRERKARADYDPGFFGNIDENPGSEVAQNDRTLWRLGADWALTDVISLRLSGGGLETDRISTDDFGAVEYEYHGERRFADLTARLDFDAVDVTLGATAADEDIIAVEPFASVDAEQKEWGAFAVAQAQFGALDLTAAVRHDDFDGFGGHATWRAGANYHLSDNARIYAAYGTAFRAPSLYERFVSFGDPNLDPEESKSWEIGGDIDFALFGQDDGLSLGALYRSSEIENLIGFFGFSYANIDEAEIDYAEGRVEVRPLSWLTTRVVYANTDARDAQADTALQRRPRHAWRAELEAAHGPFEAKLSWREVGARLDTVYDDFGFWSGVGRVEAYDIVRASAAWNASEEVRLYIAADNVTDETYEPVNGFAGAPASVLVGVQLRPQ